MTQIDFVRLVGRVLAENAAHAIVYGGDEPDTGTAADITAMVRDICTGIPNYKRQLKDALVQAFDGHRNCYVKEFRRKLEEHPLRKAIPTETPISRHDAPRPAINADAISDAIQNLRRN